MSRHNFIIPENLDGLRVDKALTLYCGDTSRSQIQKAIKHQKLLLNGQIVSNLSLRVKKNDDIDLLLEEEVQPGIVSSNIPLDIIYEDNDLIVLNKSSSMTVHPGAGDYKDTLVNALLYHTDKLSDEGGEIRPGIVHRLDKNTSGLMVVAKNNAAHRGLATQIESRTLKRKYKALVWGIIKPPEGIITQPMARSKLDRKKMTTECSLETGRTHQIRVHLSHIGHSIVGDQTYGNNKRKTTGCPETLREVLIKFDHQALHSFYISFIHPITEVLMEFEKELPVDYNNLITCLKTS